MFSFSHQARSAPDRRRFSEAFFPAPSLFPRWLFWLAIIPLLIWILFHDPAEDDDDDPYV